VIMWINPNSLVVYKTHSEIRQAYYNVSFPTTISEDSITSIGLLPVSMIPAPKYNPTTHFVEEVAPIQINGFWTQQWSTRALTSEELKARVPTAVSPREARLVLRRAGLLSAVEAWIAQADEETQIEWEFALEIRRDWPTLSNCAAILGLTEEQLDGLFIQASSL
jgi:hypothetical protein